MHTYTFVLAVTTPVPYGDYVNRRPYEERAWCHVELRLASIVKNTQCLWDLSRHKEGKEISFAECRDELPPTRPPLTGPPQVAKELRDGLASGALCFTSEADADVVPELYAKAFVRAFDTFRMYDNPEGPIIWFNDLGWTTADVPTIVAAIEYAGAHCRPRDARGRDVKLELHFFGPKFAAVEGQLKAAVAEAPQEQKERDATGSLFVVPGAGARFEVFVCN